MIINSLQGFALSARVRLAAGMKTTTCRVWEVNSNERVKQKLNGNFSVTFSEEALNISSSPGDCLSGVYLEFFFCWGVGLRMVPREYLIGSLKPHANALDLCTVQVLNMLSVC